MRIPTSSFLLAAGGGGADPPLDPPAVRHPELDLAVLRLAALGDVQLRHDLEPGHDGPPVGTGDLLVLDAGAVHAVADHRVLLRAVRLPADGPGPGPGGGPDT